MNSQELAKIVLRALGTASFLFGMALTVHTVITALTHFGSEEGLSQGDTYLVIDTSLPISLLAAGVLLFLFAPVLSKWVAK